MWVKGSLSWMVVLVTAVLGGSTRVEAADRARNAQFRAQLAGTWTEIAAIQEKLRSCYPHAINTWRENTATVCSIPPAAGETKEMLEWQENCLTHSIAYAEQTLDGLKKQFSDSFKCKALNALDWAVGKFCGEFATVCAIIRDGKACYQAARKTGGSGFEAVKSAWRAVPGIGQIVADGWSLSAVKNLASTLASGAGSLLDAARKAASQCWDWTRRSASTAADRVAEEAKRILVEGWQALKTANCGRLVEVLSGLDPMQLILNKVSPEFVSTCAVKFKQGFICMIPDTLKAAYQVVEAAAKTAWDNKAICAPAAAFTLNPAVALGCGLGIYVGKQAPRMVEGAKKIWGCLKSLRAKKWFSLVKDAACEFAGMIVFDMALMALSEGGYLPAFATKLSHWMMGNEKLMKAAMGGMAATMEVQMACGGGHGGGGHGTSTPGSGSGHGSGASGGHSPGTPATPAGSDHAGHGTSGTTASGTGHAGGSGGASSHAGTAPGAAANTGHLTGDRVNFRKTPSTKSSVLGLLRRCEKVEIVKRNVKGGGVSWTKVKARGKVGYVASQYVGEGVCQK